ncbi:MAG: nucleoside deaminase [Parachlamydiales bacterium]|nr:nucleoside deaminase [Parachlamydiales bacterium]
MYSEKKDRFFMKEALKQARIAYASFEVPIGAVLVYKGKIIARGYNRVELLQDATAHAEILCITSAAEILNNWRLKGTTLYCTLEPCPMCAGAILASRIDRLVWGAPDIRMGANGSWIDMFAHPHPMHRLIIKKNVLSEPAEELMRKFFAGRRKK